MKRFLLPLILLSIVVSGILILFSEEILDKLNISKPTALQTLAVIPIAYLVDEDQTFNPMYPYFNKMEAFSIKDSVAVFKEGEAIHIKIDGISTHDISYNVIDPISEEVPFEGRVSTSDISIQEQQTSFSVELNALEKDKRYVLNLETNSEGKPINFYQSFYISDVDTQALIKSVKDAHLLMFDKDSAYKNYIVGNESGGTFYQANENSSPDVLMFNTLKDFVKMNEPIPEIISYNPATDNYVVRLKYTIAQRQAYDFIYWDFAEEYTASVTQGAVKMKHFERTGNKKNQPYYDENQLQWVLDEGSPQEEKESLVSNNDKYLAIVYKNEIWLLNKTYNELTKVFGFDVANGDYVMDEGDQHRIKLLEIDDQGNIKYLVYGYMASGDFAGYNGILINSYEHKSTNNNSLLFVKLPMSYEEIDYYMDHISYYDSNKQQLFLTLQTELYSINLKKSAFDKVLTMPDYATFTNTGLMYAYNPKNKENLSIQLIDLTAKRVNNKGQQIMRKDTNLKVIGVINEGLIVGTYKIENTYEHLNGDVFYPLNTIYLVDASGDMKKLAEAQPKAFLQDIVINKSTGVIEGTNYTLAKYGSKISYQKGDSMKLYQFNSEHIATEPALINEVAQDMNAIRINHKGTTLNETFIGKASNSHRLRVLLDTKREKEVQLYEVYQGNQLIGASKILAEGLRMSKAQKETQIYSVKNGERKLIYDATKQTKSIMMDVPILAQKPELIRGCESTALAMFLSHYTGQNISKMTIAEKIRKDDTPKASSNGIITFGDMHKGFVGSMTERAQPGLGVYAEPIYELAKEYADGVQNITGAGFDQVLNFVGSGKPVWVITPANYNKVSNSILQQWLTPSGYMEVTFLEHSVVIVGYDENYVYLNDPLQGRVIKQPKKTFQIGWENIGSQALVVTP